MAAKDQDPCFVAMMETLSLEDYYRDPLFETGSLEASSLTLKYPRNVIVVSKPCVGKKIPTPTVAGEILKPSISSAIEFAKKEALCGRSKRFSIVVHEGVYVDELSFIAFGKEFPVVDFSLEIVGLRGVKLVCEATSPTIFGPVYFTLRNVALLDLGRGSKPTFAVGLVAEVELIDVKITSMKSFAVSARDDGTRLVLTNCFLNKCQGGFQVFLGAQMRVTNCFFSQIANLAGTCNESKFTAQGTRFIDCQSFAFIHESDCVFEDCELEWWKYWKPMYESPSMVDDVTGYHACQVDGGSRLRMTRCSFNGFDVAIPIQGSNSRVELSSCRVAKTGTVFKAKGNAGVKATDCSFDAQRVLEMYDNIAGVAEFTRNEVSTLPPIIVKDEGPKKIVHDFELVTYVEKESFVDPRRPGRKERSNFTKRKKADLKKTGDVAISSQIGFGCDQFKACENCRTYEGYKEPRGGLGYSASRRVTASDDKSEKGKGKKSGAAKSKGRKEVVAAGAKATSATIRAKEEEWEDIVDDEIRIFDKYKYCIGCKVVCYCSKKCQKEHWPDHKLVCSRLAKK